MERLYLILDSEGHALTQAVLESAPDGQILQLRLPDGVTEDYTTRGELQLIGLDDSSPAHRGFVERQRGSRIVIHATADLGVEARENLRVPTDFKSVIYPVTGRWRGQRPVQGCDLSCGGVAFYTMEPLAVGEIAEIVLPVTDEPLLLHFRVLRQLASDTPVPLYAARFIDLILDQEILIRKAVFGIQVRDLH